jgi:hypothetical protein
MFKGRAGVRRPFDWRSLMSSGWGGYATNQFPSHIKHGFVRVDDAGTLHNMTFAAGVTGVDFDDDRFLAPAMASRWPRRSELWTGVPCAGRRYSWCWCDLRVGLVCCACERIAADRLRVLTLRQGGAPDCAAILARAFSST